MIITSPHNRKATEIQLTIWFSKQCPVIRSEVCVPRSLRTPELIIRKTRGTWYWQREMTQKVCDREHLSASVRKKSERWTENVCARMIRVTLHFRADTEGPLFGQWECEQDGCFSPQAQISLSYLTQQILCKSSRCYWKAHHFSPSLSHPSSLSHLRLSLFDSQQARFNKMWGECEKLQRAV